MLSRGVRDCLLGVALLASLCDGAASHAESQSAPDLGAQPDTGLSCPLGYVRAAYFQVFEADSHAIARIVPQDRAHTVVRLREGQHTGKGLRQRLGALSKSEPTSFIGVGAGLVFFPDSARGALLDADGDGFACSIRPIVGGAIVKVCLVADSVVAASIPPASVRDIEALMVSVRLRGSPRLLVVRCRTMKTSDLRREQATFHKGFASVASATSAGLAPSGQAGELVCP